MAACQLVSRRVVRADDGMGEIPGKVGAEVVASAYLGLGWLIPALARIVMGSQVRGAVGAGTHGGVGDVERVDMVGSASG